SRACGGGGGGGGGGPSNFFRARRGALLSPPPRGRGLRGQPPPLRARVGRERQSVPGVERRGLLPFSVRWINYCLIKVAMKQVEFQFPKRGGKREGAGRKRAPGKRPGVPHRARPAHKSRFPVHLTLRARPGLPSFRESALFAELRECIRKASR